MNIFKMKFKLLSLLIIFIVSIFVTSCQQETIKPQIDDKISIEKMATDADVVNFIEAYYTFSNELIESIKANSEEFETHLSEENYDAIDDLLNTSYLIPLMESMIAKREIAMSKYPTLPDLFEQVAVLLNVATPTVTERCSPSFLNCSIGCDGDFQCSIACWWWWCESSGF